MAEERENDYFERTNNMSSSQRRSLRPPPKSVDECLDGLSEILKENGGRLPVE